MHKILVIEDELSVRTNILKILEFENFQVMGAEDGAVGVALAHKHLPDLIICDIMMPGLDGYEVRNALSQSPETAVIPFMFLTAKADRGAVRLGMALGADDYITKPFTRDELLEAVFVRLDKQAVLQHQLKEKLDQIRGHITTSLPAELLGPLNQIQTFLRSQLDPNVANESPTAEEAYAFSLHLERQLQNFLLYALLETTAQDPLKTKLLQGSTTTLTQEILATVALEKAQQYNREADLKLDLTETTVTMLETNLSKIAEELIDNAFKFSSPNAVVLVKSKAKDRHFVLDIYNQGAGLTRAQIQELSAYVQFGRKLNGKGGAGLGLSITRCLAELHGGKFIIESQPSQWTIARIELPITPLEPEANATVSADL